jgi:hypothetical protein
MRAVFILLCAAAAAAAAYFGQPFVGHNSDLVVVLTTVFAVFAGFLIAIITILGDPSLIPDGSWRIAEARRDNIERRLIWHSWLFVLYLLTIGLLFTGLLLEKAVSADWLHWREWIERAYLFFGVFSFLLSFALPWALMKLQRARVDAEIERRRREAGIQGASDA